VYFQERPRFPRLSRETADHVLNIIMNNANVNNASLNSACKSGNLETFLSGRVFYEELRYPLNEDSSRPSKSATSCM